MQNNKISNGIQYIAVFCSSRDVDEEYIKPAREFAELLAKNGYGLVWGGTDRGLMKVIASGVQDGGGKLYGVSLDVFHNEARANADEMIVVKSLGERKSLMLEKGDAVVGLVGGARYTR
jgi:uncharacterized protein (TIGR00730 family)